MKHFFSLLLLCFYLAGNGQPIMPADSNYLLKLNQQIDDAVVKQDVGKLEKWYAEDFVFSHGSGRVEGKAGWMTSVKKGNFISRTHDSVNVELHPGLAILQGKLSVSKKNKEAIDGYYLYYFRVYAYRQKQWQLISHKTFAEFHEKD